MNRVAALVLCALVAGGVPAHSEEAESGDQWKITDRSMMELLDDGYELVAVVPLSSGSRGLSYFLKNHRKLARCREETSLSTPLTQVSRGAATSQNFSPSDLPVPTVRERIECAELVRRLQ